MNRLWALALVPLLVACGAAGSEPPVTEAMRAYVEGGRESLEQNQDGLLRSRFVFHGARCREDGGLVLLFDQRGLFGSEGFAFAISGNPQDDPGAWGGGFASAQGEMDDEIERFLGGREIPCGS